MSCDPIDRKELERLLKILDESDVKIVDSSDRLKPPSLEDHQHPLRNCDHFDDFENKGIRGKMQWAKKGRRKRRKK